MTDPLDEAETDEEIAEILDRRAAGVSVLMQDAEELP